MNIKFKSSKPWIVLETAIEGSKASLRETIKILNDKNIGCCVNKHSATRFDIMVKNKKKCILKTQEGNNEKSILLSFLNGEQSKTIKTLEELDFLLKEWATNYTEPVKIPTGSKKPKNPNNSFIRKEKYSIEDVLSKRNNLPKLESDVEFDGDMIHMNSLRYHTFAEKGLKCVCCGVEAQYFYKESTFGCGRYHFNLYGVDKYGREKLFTKDHILPKSKGGKDHLDNMQTMCSTCNGAKGNKIEGEYVI